MFTIDELNEHLNTLRATIGDEASALISEGLLAIVSNYTNALNRINELETDNASLKANNEELLQVNGKLYLQVGSALQGGNSEEQSPEKNEEEIKITDIIDEKGELI